MNDQPAMMPIDEFEEWVFDNEVIIMEYLDSIPYLDRLCILFYIGEMWARFQLDPYNDPAMYADSLDWDAELENYDIMDEPLDYYVSKMIDEIERFKKIDRLSKKSKIKLNLHK